MTFNDFKISENIKKGVFAMGFEEPTGIQAKAIPLVYEGKDIIAQAPTGTGKTCAFGIPVLDRLNVKSENAEVLILCPTRELVVQVCAELRNVCQFKEGIRLLPIYGGQNIDRQLAALRRKPQVIIGTPGRIMDHLRRRTLRLENLKVLILDEADEMLNMGFKDDIDTILLRVPKERHTILFSATMPKEILEISRQYQKDALHVKVEPTAVEKPLIKQYFVEVKDKNKLEALTRIIDANNFKLCLVFCNTKKRVDELAHSLYGRGYVVEGLHGDMRQSQRDKVMQKFRNGKLDILIATDVAARGIDVDDIDVVFNYDIPNDDEYYVHRIGRTGRAQRQGASYTFVTGREMYRLKDYERTTKSRIEPCPVPDPLSSGLGEKNNAEEYLKLINQILKTNKPSAFNDYIQSFLDSINAGDDFYTTLDVASALLKLALENNLSGVKEDRSESVKGLNALKEKDAGEKDSVDFRGAEKEIKAVRETRAKQDGLTRLFIGLGTKDRIDPDFLTDLIALNTPVDKKDIANIKVLENFSFAEVPSQNANDVIELLNNKLLNGRKIILEKANMDGRKKAR
jgi:ATP-dependent RNA helicase DeaD